MTEALISYTPDGRHIYAGLSSDTKSTAAIPPGSKWIETDTGETHLFAGGAWSPQNEHVVDGNLTCLGYQQITSLSASVSLTVPTGARVALIQAETQNVRWRDDGTDPTATVGMLLATTSDGFWYNGNLAEIEFIEVTTSAKLNVSYYK